MNTFTTSDSFSESTSISFSKSTSSTTDSSLTEGKIAKCTKLQIIGNTSLVLCTVSFVIVSILSVGVYILLANDELETEIKDYYFLLSKLFFSATILCFVGVFSCAVGMGAKKIELAGLDPEYY